MKYAFNLPLSNSEIWKLSRWIDDQAYLLSPQLKAEKADGRYRVDIVSYYDNQYAQDKQRVQQKVRAYLAGLDNKPLDAGIISRTFFPKGSNGDNGDYDFFISHSHNDDALALRLKYILEEGLGLKVFVDSTVWGSADELLENLNEQYNRNSDDELKYGDCMYTASNVYLILASAITEVLRHSKNVLFLDTANSVLSLQRREKQADTSSPWIYHELFMTRLLLETRVRRFDEGATFRHTADLSDFMPLICGIFKDWIQEYIGKNDPDALNHLYKDAKLFKINHLCKTKRGK